MNADKKKQNFKYLWLDLYKQVQPAGCLRCFGGVLPVHEFHKGIGSKFGLSGFSVEFQCRVKCIDSRTGSGRLEIAARAEWLKRRQERRGKTIDHKEEGDQDPLKDERWKSNFAREFSQNHRYRTQYEVSVIQGEAIRVAASITTRASS